MKNVNNPSPDVDFEQALVKFQTSVAQHEHLSIVDQEERSVAELKADAIEIEREARAALVAAHTLALSRAREEERKKCATEIAEIAAQDAIRMTMQLQMAFIAGASYGQEDASLDLTAIMAEANKRYPQEHPPHE